MAERFDIKVKPDKLGNIGAFLSQVARVSEELAGKIGEIPIPEALQRQIVDMVKKEGGNFI